jgi:phosphoglycolate phosphatase-like HAD superfamily hydrolase
MIQAVIFDVDGTLVDSVDLHAEAWAEAFARFGKDVPARAVRPHIGKGGDHLLPVFLSPEELKHFGKELDHDRGELFKRRYLDRIRPFPQVRPLLEQLRLRGIRLALASSAKGDELQRYKELAGISDLIDEETSKDDTESSKPDPDIVRAALRRLGKVDPSLTRMVGDTPHDAMASVPVGVPCVGVTCGGWEERVLRAAGCQAVFAGPAELLSRLDEWTGEAVERASI